MYVQYNIHITGIHKYPGIKLFEAFEVHMLKVDVPFTVKGIYKAPKFIVQECKMKLCQVVKHDGLSTC